MAEVAYRSRGVPANSPINFINGWPSGHYEQCVPSRISYVQQAWTLAHTYGFAIPAGQKASAWLKLRLDGSETLTDHEGDTRMDEDIRGIFNLPPCKSPAGAISDFLAHVYGQICKEIPEKLDRDLESLILEFWVTGHDSLHVLTEGEAAAQAVINDLWRDLKCKDALLVCDCGGGTVDMASYYVAEVKGRRYFKPICSERGAKCGSAAIDAKFISFLNKKLGDGFVNYPTVHKGPGSWLLDEFEDLKHNFDARKDEYKFRIDGSLQLPGLDHYEPDTGILTLSKDELCDNVFNPVFDKIMDLIISQINEAIRRAKEGNAITRLVMVGGLSSSVYLQKRIRNSSLVKQGLLRVLFMADPQLAVASGAALRGLDGIFEYTSKFPESYGFMVNRHVVEGDDKSPSRQDRASGEGPIRKVICWAIRQGEQYLSNYCYAQEAFFEHHHRAHKVHTIPIYRTTLESLPTHIPDGSSDLHTAGYLRVDFSTVPIKNFPEFGHGPDKGYMLRCVVELKVKPMSDTLTITARYNETEIGEMTVHAPTPF
ncbi:Hsp70 family protein [Aspergillus stella-maris]|uniref:Hsp70 family protein n=1 Tax=Aspergillus stella-maris TaxID=1810926 RepID=UPI003CCCDFD0